MPDLTPESLAELRRLLDAYDATTHDAQGFMIPAPEYTRVAWRAVVALPALLDAAGRLTEVEAERDALAEEVADMVPRDWYGLMTVLADVYPETAFPTLPDHEARDAGPRIVSLLRRVDALAAEVDALTASAEAAEATVRRVRGMAEAWATQPTDYDEDTEQQIEDGKAIVRALDGGDPA